MDLNEIEFILKLKERIDKIRSDGSSDQEQLDRIDKRINLIAIKTMAEDESDGEVILKKVYDDTSLIREHLEIRGSASINYGFIPNEHVKVRNQLIRDNLKMENILLDITEKDPMNRFIGFCVSAFFQVEEIINYYYNTMYPEKDNLKDAIRFLIGNNIYRYAEHHEDTEFDKQRKEKNRTYLNNIKSLSYVDIGDKMNAFTNHYYGDPDLENTGATLNSLKLLRNNEVHRSNLFPTIINPKQEAYVVKFCELQNYNQVRHTLVRVILSIKNKLYL